MSAADERVEAAAAESRRHHIRHLHGGGVFSCACGERFEDYEGTSTEALERHRAERILAAADAASGDVEAELANLQADYDRLDERLWRLAALAGWTPVQSKEARDDDA